MAIDTRRARRHLTAIDPAMAALIARVGPCRYQARVHADPFTTLVRAIVAQQVSAAAARTIFARLCALFPRDTPLPARTLRLTDEALRGAGLSRAKVLSVRDLATHISDARLDLAALPDQSDADAVAALTAVKGIGTWTAEVFLMFHLQRPDVFPAGDLALMVAIQRAYKLRQRPTPARARALAEAWRPHRSVASWYLWHSLSLPKAP
ncbi:MAG: DNA-3-methyladenine glycosylase 2 family protein [Acidobacteriota bacterium]